MNSRKKFFAKILGTAVLFSIVSILIPGRTAVAEETSIPVYHDIPAYQQKDVFSEETENIDGISVNEEVDGTVKSLEKPVSFLVFNTTKQEIENTVQSEGGKLPELRLIKNHNYMIVAQDTEYKMQNVFVWVKDGKLLNIKENASSPYDYPELSSLTLVKRTGIGTIDPEEDRRCLINLDVLYGTGPMSNVNFRLVSDVETIEATSKKGKLRAELLEEVTYMVIVDHPDYWADPFPIVIKDKSEYGGVRYSYDHSDCHLVEKIQLTDKKDEHKNDTTVTSLSGKTTVTGFNFKDFLIAEKNLEKDFGDALESASYDVIDIKVINPHRWEISKLAEGEFSVTEKIDAQKIVNHVYYVDNENQLQEIAFEQDDDTVHFTMNSLSLYPIVIEYEPVETPVETPVMVSKITVKGDSKKIAAGKAIQLKASVMPENAENKVVTWKSSNTKYATVTANGKVTVKKAGAGKSVKITATATDGSQKTATYQIQIMKHAVKNIKLTANKTVKAGKKVTVKPTVETTGKNANKKLKWSTSNEKYATVSSGGVVTAKKAGKGKSVRITAAATDGSGKKKTIKIYIK